MKKVFYLPHLMLIALGGLLACLCGWNAAEEWLAERHGEITRRALE